MAEITITRGKNELVFSAQSIADVQEMLKLVNTKAKRVQIVAEARSFFAKPTP